MKKLLVEEEIAMHPFVVVELALGSLKDRRKTLEDLDGLPQVEVAYQDEVRSMIEARSLYSAGIIGLTDAHLIASCLLTRDVQLWPRDIRLAGVSRALGVIAIVPLLN